MEKKKIFQVVSQCRQLLKFSNAFNEKIDWRITSFDTLLPFIINIVLLGACMLVMSLIWFCFDSSFDVVKISFAMTTLITGIVSVLFFVFMYKNKKFLSETFELLQNIVEQRK